MYILTLPEYKLLPLKESKLEVPDIENSFNFWHGGNLSEYNDMISQRNGRYEYGAGLYLTNHYDIARRYSKGSRKLYLVTVSKGNDIRGSYIDTDKAVDFINEYVIKSLRKDIIGRVLKYESNGKIKALNLNDIILNHKAIKHTNTLYLRKFLVDNDIDYEIIDNAFGAHDKMMVLYNMGKIINTIQVKPGDIIDNYVL